MDERAVDPTGDDRAPVAPDADPGDGSPNRLPWHHPLPTTGWTPVPPTPLWAPDRSAAEQDPTAQPPTDPWGRPLQPPTAQPPTAQPPTAQPPTDPWGRPLHPFSQGADQPPAAPVPPGAGGGGAFGPPPPGRPPYAGYGAPGGGYDPFGSGAPTPWAAGGWGYAHTPPAPAPAPTRRRRVGSVVSALVLIVVVGGIGAGLGAALANSHSNAGGNPQSGSSGLPNSSGGGSQSSPNLPAGSSLSRIVASVDPAVVDVTASLADQSGEDKGTGMIVTSSGEVLTNNHVVDNAVTVMVQIDGSGPNYTAKVLGVDKSQDLALLQIEGAPTPLKTVHFGNSSSLQRGDEVIAIGNAGGVGGTPAVTTGTVTDLDRTIVATDSAMNSSEQLSGLIEHDATLEPGNSGGPLVNSSGQVVGINTAAAVNGSFSFGGVQEASNQGYAIPINTATTVMGDIRAQVRTGHSSSTIRIRPAGEMGVEVTTVSNATQSEDIFNGPTCTSLPVSDGAVVVEVVPGTPAQAAGIQPCDTIVSFDGTSVSDPTQLTPLVQSKTGGDRVTVTWVDQSGKRTSASLRLIPGAWV